MSDNDTTKPVAKKITPQLYKELCDYYRENGGVPKRAASDCGTTLAVAKKAWDTGFVLELGTYAVPIKMLIANEMLAVRAEIEKQETEAIALTLSSKAAKEEQAKQDALFKEEETQERARRSALRSQIREAKNVKKLQQNAGDLLDICGDLAHVAKDLMGKVKEELPNVVVRVFADGKNGEVQLIRVIRLMEAIATVEHKSAEVTRLSMELERMRLGEPTSIVGIKQISSPNESMEIIERAQRAIERAKRQGVVPQTVEIDAELVAEEIKDADVAVEGGLELADTDDYPAVNPEVEELLSGDAVLVGSDAP